MNGESDRLSNKDKAASLFKFIEELNKLRQKIITNVSDYDWYCPVNSIPDDPENIKVYWRDRVEGDDSISDSNVLVSVRKPEFQRCPEPDDIFADWLRNGWEDYHQEPHVIDFVLHEGDESEAGGGSGLFMRRAGKNFLWTTLDVWRRMNVGLRSVWTGPRSRRSSKKLEIFSLSCMIS